MGPDGFWQNLEGTTEFWWGVMEPGEPSTGLGVLEGSRIGLELLGVRVVL